MTPLNLCYITMTYNSIAPTFLNFLAFDQAAAHYYCRNNALSTLSLHNKIDVTL